MLRKLLCRSRISVELIVINTGQYALYCHNIWSSVCKGAGLIKGKHFDLCKSLEGVSLPYKKTVFCGVAYGCHYGSRSRKHKGTWTEYYKYGDRTDYLMCHKISTDGSHKSDNNYPCSPSVRNAHYLCLSCISGLYELYHPLYGAVLTDLGSLHLKGSELVHGATGDLVSHRFIHRHGFTCHNSLIYGGLTGNDNSVHGNALTRKHP